MNDGDKGELIFPASSIMTFHQQLSGISLSRPLLNKLSGLMVLQLNNQRKTSEADTVSLMYKQFLLPYVLFLIPSLVQPTVAHGADPVWRRAVKQNAASMLRRISRNCTRARTGFMPISNRRRLLGSYRRSFWWMSKILKRWSSYLALTSTLAI